MDGRGEYLGQPIAPEVQRILDMLMENDFDEEPSPVLVQATMDDTAEVSAEDALIRDYHLQQAQINLDRVRNSDVIQELLDFDLGFLLDPVEAPAPPPSPPPVLVAVEHATEEENLEPLEKARMVDESPFTRPVRDNGDLKKTSEDDKSGSEESDEDSLVMIWEDDKFGPNGKDDTFEPEVMYEHLVSDLSDYCEIVEG